MPCLIHLGTECAFLGGGHIWASFLSVGDIFRTKQQACGGAGQFYFWLCETSKTKVPLSSEEPGSLKLRLLWG